MMGKLPGGILGFRICWTPFSKLAPKVISIWFDSIFHMSISMFYIVDFGNWIMTMIFSLIRRILAGMKDMPYQEKLLIEFSIKSPGNSKVKPKIK